VANLSAQLLHGRVRFQLGKSIPSADAAALVKFGVEKIPGVSKVHFAGDDIEVAFAVEGAAVGLILDALTEAGFPSAGAVGVDSVDAASESEASEQSATPGPDAEEEGVAIA
jgi:hypothetical protein